MSSLSRALLVALAVLALGASRATAADPVTIDAIVSLTGSGAFAGHDSAQAYAAVERYVDATGGIRGRPLSIVVHDDQSNPQVAVQLFSELAAKHDQLILGPSLAATCGAVLPLLKGVVDYCISPAAHPKPGSTMFSGLTDSSDQFRAMFRYFALRGLRRIATMTTTDATGQDADRAVAEMAAANGITIVDREHFATTDLSVTAQAEHIKTVDPQLLIAWTTGTAFGTILRAVADVGLAVPVITSSGNMSIVQLKQYASIMPSELLFPATPVTAGTGPDAATRNAIAVFDKALAAVGVAVPSQVHQLAWDPAIIVVSALRKLGPDATSAQIHDYIASLRDWTGIQGPYDFPDYPQRGLGLSAVIITRWNPSTQRWIAVSSGGGTPLTP